MNLQVVLERETDESSRARAHRARLFLRKRLDQYMATVDVTPIVA